MTPTTPVGAGAVPTNAPDMGTLASQNLFEHMAHTSSASSQGLSPADVGANLMNSLDGSIERLQSFSTRVGDAGVDSPSASDGAEYSQATPQGAEAVGGADNKHFDRIIESLGSVFDHAIETQMVVRGTTQFSGAANTLLKGQ